MIEIKIEEKRIEINGHAGYAEHGKDIVCAAVSILVNTFANLYDCDVIENPNQVIITWNKADTSFLITGLEILKEAYPKYVSLS